MKKPKEKLPVKAEVIIAILSITMAILVPVCVVIGIFAGLRIAAKHNDEAIVRVEYGYSDSKEEWHPAFGSGFGYCEYYYDEELYNQTYKRNGYYNDVTKEDFELISSYIENFKGKYNSDTGANFSVNINSDIIDEGDRFAIIYSNEERRYDFYYFYYYDMQTQTLYELWNDD